MAEEDLYHDGDIVWVKMNKVWWPGEVHEAHRLPSDFFEHLKKTPLVVVKFFQEQNYHYINQLNQIARFNCAKKNEFIKKGLQLYYAKYNSMEKFPGDVAIAEKRTGGDPSIIYRKEFMPATKPDKTTSTGSASKGTSSRRRGQQIQPSTPSIPRVMIKPDHDTRILVPSSPSATLSPTVTATDAKYKCTSCNFTTNRINTFVWHQKTHNSPKIPQIPSKQKYEQTLISTAYTSKSTISKNVVAAEESVDLKDDETPEEPMEVALPEKSSAKRLRQSNASQTKLTEKEPQTKLTEKEPETKLTVKEPQTKLIVKESKAEDKLKNILDDWSDDEIVEDGPSGLTSNTKVSSIPLDTEDDAEHESSPQKKLKFNPESESCGTVSYTSEAEIVSQKSELKSADVLVNTIPNENVIEEKIEDKPRLGKKTIDESISAQSGKLEAIDGTNDEAKDPARSNLRSGKSVLNDQNSPPPLIPRRRGRPPKKVNNEASTSISKEINLSQSEPILPDITDTVSDIKSSSEKKLSEELVGTELDQKKGGDKKSNPKTSRKGKPRRKEEIKLANNISVAVLVEKTTTSPSIEQKLEIITKDTEGTNVFHKKLRLTSTDDNRKSIKSPKLPEQDNESNNQTENQTILDTEENKQNPNDSAQIESIADVISSSTSSADHTKLTEKVTGESNDVESAERNRFTPKRSNKATPKRNFSLDQFDVPSTSSTFDFPSTSNLRQGSQRRYENARSCRKSERLKDFESTNAEDFSAIVRAIDENCKKSDRAQQKSIDMNNSSSEDNSQLSDLNDSSIESTNSNVHSDSNSDSKADNSKDLDCFDFTEDEYVKAPPQVLNRRKRPPPAKVFQLENNDKTEEQVKLDEEAARIANQREEENQKLQAELEDFLKATTSVSLPDVPVTYKAHENFPERRAEKDPEKLTIQEEDYIKVRKLPPKERKKRIFRYRNRNQQPDVTSTSCDLEDSQDNIPTPESFTSDETIVTSNVEAVQENQSNDEVVQIEKDRNTSAHDLKIEIAETLINFPLLSPQTDRNEHLHESIVEKFKPKECTKSVRTIKKLRNVATAEDQSSVAEGTILKKLNQQRDTMKGANELFVHGNGHNFKSNVPQMHEYNSTTSVSSTLTGTSSPTQLNENVRICPVSNDSELINETFTKSSNTPPTTHTASTQTTVNTTTKSTNRDFSRIRLIEKIDNHTPSSEEITSAKSHPLPLKKTLILTQNEGTSLISRIPKKRKSQVDNDIPAFVIEKPKDHLDETSDSNNSKMLTKKEPKSFVVTKSVKKQVTGEFSKPIAGSVVVQSSPEVKESIDRNTGQRTSLQETSTNANQSAITNVSSINTSSIGSPVIVSSHIVVQKNSLTPSGQKPSQSIGKRTATSAATPNSNVLGGISMANRPCTIAPAKKASYRKPTDMTDWTQKQIGIDGKGNPVMVYTKISPTVTQTPPVKSQATIVMKRNEPVPSTPQLVQSFTTPLQSNQGNQFVITSEGALITNKPFITTMHSTQLNKPTLTNRPNIQVHTTQIIRSPNPQQHQHLSPQSNQILIQTKPTNSLSELSPLVPVKKQQKSRRSVVNKTKATAPNKSNDKTSSVVRRIQSPATGTQQIQSNQVVLNVENNHIGNATTPVPPLIPLNEQSQSITSRKQLPKQPTTQKTFIQEPQMQSKTPHVDVVEQHHENIQEILALPGDTFGGPPGSYYLCKLNEMGIYIPIDHQPLYLDITDNTNLLKPNVPEAATQMQTVEVNQTEIVPQQSPALFQLNSVNERVMANNQPVLPDQDANNPKYLINISDGQQLIVDQQSLMALANGEEFPQFVTSDGHQIILQSGQHDILSAIAFAGDGGLIGGQQILIPEQDLAVIQGQGGNHDILAAALAGTEGFSQEQFIDNVLIQSSNGVEDIVDQMVYHTIPQPTVTALTNETNAVLTQPPIMSTLEQPSKKDRLSPNNSLELIGQNLDESLAVIGVTTSNTHVPTSLELPITITNPAIAAKTTSMSSVIYPPPSATTEHDLHYELFSSTLPTLSTHHLTQSMAINESYRTVNVINSIRDIDMDSNIASVASRNDQRSLEKD